MTAPALAHVETCRAYLVARATVRATVRARRRAWLVDGAQLVGLALGTAAALVSVLS